MEKDKPREFVSRIIEKTLDGSLKWEKTAKDSTYQTTLGAYVIQFLGVTSMEGSTVYVLKLFNSEGTNIESYNDEMFDARGAAANPESFYKRMERAHLAARRQAIGIDKVLDDLLEELK